MSNKFIRLSILLATIVFISGCIFNNNTGTQVNTLESAIIPKTNLPSGFTYMGIHEPAVEIGGSSMNATEGVYRYNGDDIYIQVIKNDKPDALIAQYKLDYKDAKYNPFEEISFNGHKATQVTDYSTINGHQKSYYTVIWANDIYMFIVGKSPNAQALIALASATGN